VASPVTTRARASSFNSMFANGDFSSGLIPGFNNGHGFPQPIIHHVRRNSLPGASKKNTAKSKRTGGSRVSSRRTTSNGIPSPAETDSTPTMKHLNHFVRSSSVEYDIDGFVEEMRREKHINMLIAQDDTEDSDDSEIEETAEAKKPRAGGRRPASAGRRPANWIPPIPGLVEAPATRLRNRQQKEKEKLDHVVKETPAADPSNMEQVVPESVR
jgi:hypothetical protein